MYTTPITFNDYGTTMIPSANDISNFVEVASTLNVSRAAERLGISQPTLSLSIQRLESELGVPVLVRSKRGVALTQAGKQLLIHSKQLMQSWEQIRGHALASIHEIQGSFTIGCHPSVGLCTLSSFLPALMRKHHNLHISLKHDLSRKIAEGVISAGIDIGIVVNPVKHPDLIIHKLYDDEVTFWYGPSDKTILEQYKKGEGILLCDMELNQSQQLLKQLKSLDINFSRTIASSSLEVITDLTAQGCGIGIIPSHVAALSKAPIKKVPKAPVFNDEICLIFRVENKNVKSIQSISQAVQELFRK